MKRLIILLLLSNFSFSQEKGVIDFNIGVGFLSSSQIADSFNIKTPTGIDDIRINSRINPYNFTFKYAVKKKWFLNAEGVYESTKDNLINDKNIVIGEQMRSNYTFGIGSEYHYLNREILQLYSGIMMGYTVKISNYNETKNESLFNPHFTLIGIRIGKKIGVTIELGAGYKGITNFGLSYQP